MKVKKVRGHHRLQTQIVNFFNHILSQSLNFDDLSDYDYVKFRIWPWSGFTYGRISKLAEPKSKTRQLIIKGFLDVFDHWKNQLKNFDEPYDLVLWFHSPYISKSQIVFGARSRLHFYRDTFFKPDFAPKFNLSDKAYLAERLKKITWQYALDEEQLDNTTVGDLSFYRSVEDFDTQKKWFDDKMKKPHRTTRLTKPVGNCTEVYSFKIGSVWIGR